MYTQIKKIKPFEERLLNLLKELKFNGVNVIPKLRELFKQTTNQLEEVRENVQNLNIFKLDKETTESEGNVIDSYTKSSESENKGLDKTIKVTYNEDKQLKTFNEFTIFETEGTEKYRSDILIKGDGVQKLKEGNNITETINTKSNCVKNVETKTYIESISAESSSNREIRGGSSMKKEQIVTGEILIEEVVNNNKTVRTVKEDSVEIGGELPVKFSQSVANNSFNNPLGVITKKLTFDEVERLYVNKVTFEAYKTEVNTRFTTAEGKITALENKVEALETDNAKNKSDITALQSSLNQALDRITALETKE